MAILRHPDTVLVIKFSPNGQLVATSCMDLSCRVFEATTGQILSKIDFDIVWFGISALVWQDDNRVIVGACNSDGSILQWKVDQASLDTLDTGGHDKEVISLAYQTSSSMLGATVLRGNGMDGWMHGGRRLDGELFVYLLSSSTSPIHRLPGFQYLVTEVKFHPVHPILAALHSNGKV